jgi:DNA-3-methyladenine glycosylase
MAHDLSKVLGIDFYSKNPLVVAKSLIGKQLFRRLKNQFLAGTIVETEAYGETSDPASHTFKGRTPRNEVMFGEPGHAYIYFTYGNHYCLNFVTGRFRNEKAGAVLIRALEPTFGIETMKINRRVDDLLNLTSGPGKLCKALEIDRTMNGIDVTSSNCPIFVKEALTSFPKPQSSKRIGITLGQDKNWRFFLNGNPHVSRKLIYPKSNISI